jgi:hypothetical protein
MKRILMTTGFARLMVLAAGLATAAFLTSCVTPPATPEEAVYKFQVLRYTEAVEVKHWSVDPSQSSNPEGTALNTITAMQHGDVDQWLASWDKTDRPALNAADREKLLAKWQSLKNGHIVMQGRVVAGSDLIVELSVVSPSHSAEVFKFPLRHENGQWLLFAMDPNSEFLNWETSKSKTLGTITTRGLEMYLSQFKEARR